MALGVAVCLGYQACKIKHLPTDPTNSQPGEFKFDSPCESVTAQPLRPKKSSCFGRRKMLKSWHISRYARFVLAHPPIASLKLWLSPQIWFRGTDPKSQPY